MTFMAFEPGSTYGARLITDSNTLVKIKVQSRTAKTITTTANKVLRIKVYNGVEQVKPLGHYSMAPIISADQLVREAPPPREEPKGEATKYTLVISERIIRYGTITVTARSPAEAIRLGRLRYKETGGAMEDERGEEDIQHPRIEDLESDDADWNDLNLELAEDEPCPADSEFAAWHAADLASLEVKS